MKYLRLSITLSIIFAISFLIDYNNSSTLAAKTKYGCAVCYLDHEARVWRCLTDQQTTGGNYCTVSGDGQTCTLNGVCYPGAE